MYLAIIGKDDIEKGLNIIGAHADSPRLDLKPNPLYEDSELAFLKHIIMEELKNINGQPFH